VIHLTLHQLSAYLDGELVETSTEIVRRHLAECGECTLKFATLEEQEQELAPSLSHDPDDAFFERLAISVEEAIPQESATPGKTEPGSALPLGRGAPAVAARTTAVAPSGPATGPTPAGLADDPKVDERAQPQAPTPGRRDSLTPWIAAVVVLLVGASVAVVAIRSGRLGPDSTRRGGPSESTPRVARDRAGKTPEPVNKPPADMEVARSAPQPAPTPAPTPAVEPAPARVEEPDQAPAPIQVAALAPPPAPLVQTPSPAAPPTPAASAPAAISAAPKPVAAAPSEAPGRPKPDEGSLQGGPSKNLFPVIRTKTVVETPGRAVEPLAPAPEGDAGAQQGRAAPAPNPANEPVPRPDVFAGLPPNLSAPIRIAERKSEEASLDPSAASYEAAAAEWERALSLLRRTPHEGAVRFRLAEARYGAWQVSPDAYRAAAATAALRSCIVFAAPGPDRDEAKRRLSEIKH